MTRGEGRVGLVEIAAGLYGRLPKGWRSALIPCSVPAYGAARRLGRGIAGVRKPVHWLEGRERTGGRELSILAFVEDRALPFLAGRAFSEVRRRERLGSAYPGFAASAFPAHRARADLLVVHGDSALVRTLSPRGFLSIPDWVGFGLDLDAGDGGGWTFPVNKTVRENLRRIRKHGYTFEVTTDPAEFDRFYREMYLPFIPPRFGRTAEVVGPRLMRLFFDGGLLLLVRQGGERVAGNIILWLPDRAKSVIIGLRGGDAGLKRRAALSASYVFTIRWAMDNGVRRLDFGECRPLLEDGLFTFKRRWGMALEKVRLQADAYGLKVLRYGPAVRDLLAGNPFVFLDRGALKGLVLARSPLPLASAEVSALARAHLVPGLERLFVLSEAGFRGGPREPLDDRVVCAAGRPADFFRDLPACLGPGLRRVRTRG